jgi:hypothetical protein
LQRELNSTRCGSENFVPWSKWLLGVNSVIPFDLMSLAEKTLPKPVVASSTPIHTPTAMLDTDRAATTAAPLQAQAPLATAASAVAAAASADAAPVPAPQAAPVPATLARSVFDLRAVPALNIDALASSLELSPDAAAAAAAEFDIALAHSLVEQIAATAIGIDPHGRPGAQDAKTEEAAPSPVAVAQVTFAHGTPRAQRRADGRDHTNRGLNY